MDAATPPVHALVIDVDAVHPSHEALAPAADALRAGALVAFPTETVFGLGANALDQKAVLRIFAAKGRPADNPLIIHVADDSMLQALLPKGHVLDPVVHRVLAAFWPGPLTVLFTRGPDVPRATTGGHDTMAVRMPAHPVARTLIALAGVPVAAPSANVSGRPSPTTARHVLDDLDGRIHVVVSPIVSSNPPTTTVTPATSTTNVSAIAGVESTVLDCTRNPPVILRPGSITAEQLRTIPGMENLQVYRAAPKSSIDSHNNKSITQSDDTASDVIRKEQEVTPTTPGMKYRHYSPDCSVVLIEFNRGSETSDVNKIDELESMMSNVAHTAVVDAIFDVLMGEKSHNTTTNTPKIGYLTTVSTPNIPNSCELIDALDNIDPNAQINLLEACPNKQIWESVGNAVLKRAAERGVEIKNLEELFNKVQLVHRSLGWSTGVHAADVPNMNLFSALRAMERCGVNMIVVESVWDKDSGAAFMNRIRKAATTTIYI